MRRISTTIILAALFLTQTLLAGSTRFLLAGSRDSRNVVRFESKAPLETIIGITGKIDGTMDVDLREAATAAGQFEVELTTIKTGIDMRDQHMRE